MDGCNDCVDGDSCKTTQCAVSNGYKEYIQDPDKTCTQCSEYCTDCNSKTSCKTGKCATGSYEYQDTNNDYKCKKCMDGCKACTTGDACTTGQCETNGYYEGTNGKIVCIACPTGHDCKTCDSSGCKTCDAGKYVDNSDNKKCKAGPTHCTSATGEEICSDCKTGYHIFTHTPCPECETGCAECESHEGTGKCTKCKPGWFKETTNKCTQCGDANCISCSDATTCSDCGEGFFLSGNTCTSCASGCKKCTSATATDCSKCKDGYYMDKDSNCKECTNSVVSGGYVASCVEPPKDSDGNYISGSLTQTKTCIAGSYMGDTCTGLTGCSVFLSPNKCKTCADGFYLNNYACTSCASSCAKCTKDACSLCATGYYMSTDKVCTQCPDGCVTCTSETTCTACKPTYYLSGSECKSCTATQGAQECNCGTGSYWDSTSLSCTACIEGCNVCSDTKTCTTCKSNYYLDEKGICLKHLGSYCKTILPLGTCKTCMIGTYYKSEDNTCNDCSIIPNCKICDSTPKCTTCATGFYVNDGNCTSCSENFTNCDACSSDTLCDQCKTGHYWNTTTTNCEACMEGCTACADPKTCLICADGYRSDTKNVCHKCPPGCSTCKNETACETCMDGHYFDSVGLKCNPCHGLCATCTNSTENDCTSCIANATLSDHTCKCDSGYMYDSAKKLCVVGTTSSSAVYVFTGVLTFLVVLLTIFQTPFNPFHLTIGFHIVNTFP
eukprot:TRINITY_DN356_c0_g2_i4.p1 TRINITY_DN356_c0_g2~~TRINITY_DN356_c0_g2_i4.p1  ORF type:complete len:851 (-),score=53.31 TRINITY_DN356_c0_g2_i4:242-2413(-)